jgi:hypothetical protein
MVDENPVPLFSEWIGPALLAWLFTVAALAVVTLLAAWVVAVLRAGPALGSRNFARGLRYTLSDLIFLSPRRVTALAWLAVKESLRRKVVVGFAVFLLLAAFGGWFLDPASINLGQLYVKSVLFATTLLVCLLVILLCALSLPGDIKSHTIDTVVTKPVRHSEIILGRIAGFTVIGTGLLGLMCLVSYVFVCRGLNHTHAIDLARLAPDYGGRAVHGSREVAPQGWKGWTTTAEGHRHEVYVSSQGHVYIEAENGHWHQARDLDPGALAALQRGTAHGSLDTGLQQGELVARVPLYGRLRFIDRSGHPAEKGIDVGDESRYRTYIDGGTLATAVWTFKGISERVFPEGLPVDLNFSIFRTHQGAVDRGVPGSLTLRNPRTGLSIEAQIFPAKEYVIDSHWIARQLQTPDGRQVDLFRDLVDDGTLEIRLRCLEPQQYFGAAPNDLYLRSADASFGLNFVKGYFGIWMKMVVLISFGVMFSTFLSAPVALIATGGMLVAGLCKGFVLELSGGHVIGGGPVESLIRIMKQENLVTDLEPGLLTSLAKNSDYVASIFMRGLGAVLPDFTRFTYTKFVAAGFNIPANTILVDALLTLAMVLPVFVAGYIFLKSREVAA